MRILQAILRAPGGRVALYRAYRGLLQETLRLMRAATDDGRLQGRLQPQAGRVSNPPRARACRVRDSHRTCFWLISHGLVLHYSAWSRPSPSGLLTTRRPARPSATTKSQAPFRGRASTATLLRSLWPTRLKAQGLGGEHPGRPSVDRRFPAGLWDDILLT